MGIELGTGKEVHEFLVHVELHVGDAFPDGHDPVEGGVVGQKADAAAQGGVPQDLENLVGEVREHPDGDGGTGVDVGAEGPGHVEAVQLFEGQASGLLDDDLQDGVHGGLGGGQGIEVHLGETDGRSRAGFFGRDQDQGLDTLLLHQGISAGRGVEFPPDVDAAGKK